MQPTIRDAIVLPPDWSGFHADLKAARQNGAQIPYVDFDHVESRLIAGESLEAVQASESNLPLAYRSASEIFQQTESIELVLDGLTARQHARKQLRRALAPTILYLSLLVWIGFLGLYLFNDKINPTIIDLRNDVRLASAVDAQGQHLSALQTEQWLPAVVFGLATLVWLGPILLLTGATARVSHLLGGLKYERTWMAIAAVRTVDALLNRGVPRDKAFQLAGDLVYADRALREAIAGWGTFVDHAIPFPLIAARYQRAALTRLAWMRVVIPMALVSGVGGGFALFYCWAIFSPVVDLLHELAFPGV